MWIFVFDENTHWGLWQAGSKMAPVMSLLLSMSCIIPFSLLWADQATTASQYIVAKMMQCHFQIISCKKITSILLAVSVCLSGFVEANHLPGRVRVAGTEGAVSNQQPTKNLDLQCDNCKVLSLVNN